MNEWFIDNGYRDYTKKKMQRKACLCWFHTLSKKREHRSSKAARRQATPRTSRWARGAWGSAPGIVWHTVCLPGGEQGGICCTFCCACSRPSSGRSEGGGRRFSPRKKKTCSVTEVVTNAHKKKFWKKARRGSLKTRGLASFAYYTWYIL